MNPFKYATLVLAALFFTIAPCPSRADIADTFRMPPKDARPWTFWFWINGNITREGITADLEAMARVGIGGVLIMEVANPRSMAPEGPIKFASPEWKDLFGHVVREAGRLGLQVNMNNDAGWTGSGGPWIKPEQSMKKVVATTATITGPSAVDLVLSTPETLEGFYRDIAVFAVPQDAPDMATTSPIQLTDRMTPDGRLTWDAPAGKWVLARIGYTSTGQQNKPAPASGTGLEVDKFDPAAMSVHFESFIGKLAEGNKDLTGKTFTLTHVDSWEVGLQDWTENMPAEFRKRRGYDLMPWLPVLVGVPTGDPDAAKRFRRDFTLTCAELTDEFYIHALRKEANAKGLKLSLEGYGPRGFMNPLTYAIEADLQVSEFWIARWDAWHLLSSRLMASVAHVFGKKIVAAESFTSGAENDPYTEHPYSVKTTGDWAMTEGVNRIIFHRTVLDPWPGRDLLPGMSFAGYGWHVDRNQTWFEQSKPYMTYLARCQSILQQGQFVADVCRLVTDGETRGHVPGMRLIPQGFEPLPPGYNYDYISDKALISEMTMKDGDLVTSAGMKYKVLQLPRYTTMTVELARKVAELAEQGAIIVGPKPLSTPGLTGYPESEQQLREIAEAAWNPAAPRRVLSEQSIAQVFTSRNTPPDFTYVIDPPVARRSIKSITGRSEKRRPRQPEPLVMPTPGLNWIHHTLPEGEFYFVANPQYREVNALLTFRAPGMAPELWYPDTGEIRQPAIFTSGTTVQLPIKFDPAESVFVVFRKKANPSRQVVEVRLGNQVLFGADTSQPPFDLPFVSVRNGTLRLDEAPAGQYQFKLASGETVAMEVPKPTNAINISGPWEVAFQPKRGAPDKATFAQLTDWAKHDADGIKHFSGTATYRTTFDADPEATSGTRYHLDLGEVLVMAQVRLNGEDLGVLWKPPFRLDVTDALRGGRNELEIEVTNLWPNRMIGDEQYPDDSTPDASWVRGRLPAWPDWIKNRTPRPDPRRITFTTFKHYEKNAPLIPSGLLGPVTLNPVQELPVE